MEAPRTRAVREVAVTNYEEGVFEQRPESRQVREQSRPWTLLVEQSRLNSNVIVLDIFLKFSHQDFLISTIMSSTFHQFE